MLMAFIAGMILTAVAVYCFRSMLLVKSDNSLIIAERRKLEDEREILLTELGNLKGQLSAGHTRIVQLTAQYQEQLDAASFAREQLSQMKARLEAAEDKLRDEKKNLEQIGHNLRYEFKTLAASILDEKTQKFTEVNEERMKAILTPLKDKLTEFKQKVEETYDKESKQRFSLEEKIRDLVDLNSKLSDEANNLTNALKMNNKVQGNWGEMILESLLEHSGLTKNREYFVQEFLKDTAGNIIRDENGKTFQPDVTIVYPDGRKVIIDSKVSLVAYDAYTSCVQVSDQMNCLKEHIRSLRSHIDGLSGKNYPKYAGKALDYVILFVPVEPAFLVAVKEDVQLWKYAYDRRILMVSPTNLLAVLKIIADLWKVELQSRNAIEIAEKAGDMYDKFVRFLESMKTVGENLNKATVAHSTAMNQLSEGNGNIIRRVQQLKDMGAKARKKLPEELLRELEGGD